MRILTCSGFPSYWGNYPPNILDQDSGKTVGGGEEAFLRTAAGLRALGHEVIAYHCGGSGVWRGVEFRGREADLYGVLARERFDVVIGWSTIKPLEYAPPGARRIFSQQLNDLWIPGNWHKVDAVVSPSWSHADMIRTWGWLGPQHVVHNGLDPELYVHPHRAMEEPQTAKPWNERPMWVGHWSSPDRGLHHLLRAWPYVTKQIPAARLNVFYEIEKFLSFATRGPESYGHRAREIEREVRRAQADGTITFHGQIPRRKLAHYQLSTRVHCYPYDPFQYCEGFGTSVAQGLASGALVMTTRKDAFPELYDGGVSWLHDVTPTRAYYEYLASEIVWGLCDEQAHAPIRDRAVRIGTNYSWTNAALQMEAACKGEGGRPPVESAP